MKTSVRRLRSLWSMYLVAMAVGLLSIPVQAQDNNNNNNNNNLGGITIDPQGVVQPVFGIEQSGKLAEKRRLAAAGEMLEQDVISASPLRMVSLVRLEQAVDQALLAGEELSLEIQYLAGLQRIDYLFVYPESGDLVLAGPAEGFSPGVAGRMLGIQSGRPPLRLDDLCVALRTVRRGENIGCSIDPVPERLAALENYVRNNSTASSRAVVRQRYQQMARILGMQNIRVWGVPPGSHFGQTLVEADYRMKLLSMGLERPQVRGFRTHLSMIGPGSNSVQRWWLSPLYGQFVRSEDGTAYQLSGQRVQMSAQEELTDSAGNRTDAAFTRFSTQQYAKYFTEKFADLAAATPIFAELQNLFDLAVVAALLDRQRLSEKVGWNAKLLLDNERLPISEGNVPQQVPTVFAVKDSRKRVIGLIGGGVQLNATQTIRGIRFDDDQGSRLADQAAASFRPQADRKRSWWWD